MTPRRFFLRVVLPSAASLVILLAAIAALPARANVTLSSFAATSFGGEAAVVIDWETATEIDTIGFYVVRSSSSGGQYTRLNTTIIPAEGDPLTGWTYTYIDYDVTLSTTYYYKLEVINNDQSTEFHGPISVVAGVDPTPEGSGTPIRTPTATNTVTPTPSRTPTSSPTPTSTRSTQSNPPTRTNTPVIIVTLPGGSTITPVSSGSFATATPAPANSPTSTPTQPSVPTIATPSQALSSVLPTPTPFQPSVTQSAPSAPSLVPTDSSLVAMAPVVIATPETSGDTAPTGGGSNAVVLGLIVAAVALLGGGLYVIFHPTGRS